MIIVFSRSKELNGIGEIKRALPKIDSEFYVVESFLGLVWTLIKGYKSEQFVFSLSSGDFLIALALTRFFRRPICHVMGVYHPRQWHVMLDERNSKTRALVFRKVMLNLNLKNIIFNSFAAYNSCIKVISITGIPNIVLAPGLMPVVDQLTKVDPVDDVINIVTISRFVDFKTSSILRMIEEVDLVNQNSTTRLRYLIYGDGPNFNTISKAILKTSFPDFIRLMGPVPREDFGDVVSRHDLFFGMGFAVIHSAMIGVPSIIAIQAEKKSVSYGFFSNYDHSVNPMFGDLTLGVSEQQINKTLYDFIKMTKGERKLLGKKCAEASMPYMSDAIVEKLKFIIKKSDICRIPSVTLRELIVIRVETYLSRFNRSKFEHT